MPPSDINSSVRLADDLTPPESRASHLPEKSSRCGFRPAYDDARAEGWRRITRIIITVGVRKSDGCRSVDSENTFIGTATGVGRPCRSAAARRQVRRNRLGMSQRLHFSVTMKFWRFIEEVPVASDGSMRLDNRLVRPYYRG